jgi:ferritin
MLFWILKVTLISIVLIFLVHHLINFFKSTLTVPKIKDLVNTPTKKYENMYNIIKQPSSNEPTANDENYTLIDLLPTNEDKPTMKNELKNFLKKQLHNTDNSETNIESLQAFSGF